MKSIALSILLCLCTCLTYGQISLVKDINTVPRDANPSQGIAFNGYIYYFANRDGNSNNRVLFRSNGTTAEFIASFNPNYSTNNPNFVVMNSELYFTTANMSYNTVLYKINTTNVVTEFTGITSVRELCVMGSTLFFGGNSGGSGDELYKTDGTQVGTVLVKDIAPSGNSLPTKLTVSNGILFFVANDGTNGKELWKSDGTALGTVMVKDIVSGSGSGLLTTVSMLSVNNILFFEAMDGTNGVELWKSDGTSVGTVLVKDIETGAAHSAPKKFVAVGNTLFFVAYTSTLGEEVWKSDGTAVGTVIVKDIYNGSPGSYPTQLTSFASQLYFVAWQPSKGYELFKSDGTSAGTAMVKELSPGDNSTLDITNVFDGNVKLFFTHQSDSVGNELWATDGTAAGTKLISNLYAGTASSNPSPVGFINSKYLFSANDGIKGKELWATTGAAGNVTCIETSFGNGSSFNSLSGIDINGVFYFTADNGVQGQELWKTDGINTSLVKDINLNATPSGGTMGANPYGLTKLNNSLIFVANDGVKYRLWKSDGTASGTTVIDSGLYMNSYDEFRNIDGIIYFTANVDTFGYELCKTDGTVTGTVMIKDLNTNSMVGAYPNNFISYKNETYFIGYDGPTGNHAKLYKTNGTIAGTMVIKDFNPGGNGYIDELIVHNGKLFIIAYTDTSGSELWVSDGTDNGTFQVMDINPGVNSSNIYGMKGFKNNIYFTTSFSSANGNELWTSDGTAAGTKMVKDIVPGSGSSSPSEFIVSGDKLFFRANTPSTGQELWITDGTDTGTRIVKDIYGGNISSYPFSLISIDNFVYFISLDSTGGEYEIFKSDGTAAGTIRMTAYATTGVSLYQSALYLSGLNFYMRGENYNNYTGIELYKYNAYPFSITANASANGTITPSGLIGCSAGISKTFSMKANAGFVQDSLIVDGINVANDSTYTFVNLNANHTIRAVFKVKSINIGGGINELNENKVLTISPNPSSDFIAIEGFNSNENVTVYNAQGKSYKMNANSNRFDIRHLDAGIYFIQLNNSNRMGRFVKE